MEAKAGALSGLIVIFLFGYVTSNTYVIPELTLAAYSPKGFSASLPDNENVSQFHFHGNINDQISQLDPGNLYGEANGPSENKWTYFNPDVELKVGDTVAYWVFVQNNYLGYKQEGKTWTVKKLEQVPNCRPSRTIINGITFVKELCKQDLIFEDEFDTIDKDKWLINQYIPYYDKNYEFVSYENLDTVLFTRDGKLFIKPTQRSSVYGNLNLVEGCTRTYPLECDIDSDGQFILPPVISAKLTSKFKIKYGKIEIKAKLPTGDWIYPELHLHSENTADSRIFIAYARGNKKLLDTSGEDYGGQVLFGGPTFSYTEPGRSQYLRSFTNKQNTPMTLEEHTFTIVWEEDSMQFFVDDARYGEVMNHQFKDEAYIVLGVGVGGINDFPNNFTSESGVKPWTNTYTSQIRDFSLASDRWNRTWIGDDVALQVNSIKIWAI